MCGDQTTSALEQDNVRMCATSRIIKNNMADQNIDQNHEDDSEDEKILLLVLLLRRRRRRLRAARRRQWTKRWLQRRQTQGVCDHLLRELEAEDPEQFRQFHRMDRGSFEDILRIVSPYIVKRDTNMRSALKPRERLAVTLRFLATGSGTIIVYAFTRIYSYRFSTQTQFIRISNCLKNFFQSRRNVSQPFISV